MTKYRSGGTNTGTAITKGGSWLKLIRSKWFYKGAVYNTLHEALVANWPR